MTDNITIRHRYTDAVLLEYQPTAEQQESGLAMRAALALIECHARLWAPEAKAVQPVEEAA